MHATLPLLRRHGFPALRRGALETLQVNSAIDATRLRPLPRRCGPASHRRRCPPRTSPWCSLSSPRRDVRTLDLTGGAPELNPHFRDLVVAARALGVRVIDRCNLTILEEPGHEDLADFLAAQAVEVVASLPCYSKATSTASAAGACSMASSAASLA